MAAVDALLRLIVSENADSIRLATGQVPRLTKAGFSQPLSMPPVAAPVMDVFVTEVLAPAELAEAAQPDGVTVDYGEFTATVRRKDEAWDLSFKRRPARPRAAPAATPPTTPTPDAAAPSQLDRWLARALADGASDLVVSAGRAARLRVAGALVA